MAFLSFHSPGFAKIDYEIANRRPEGDTRKP